MDKVYLEDLPTLIIQIKDSISRVERMLTERNIESKISDEVLTVQEAAKFLTLQPSTVYALIRQHSVPVMKRFGRCYFLKSDLINHLKESRCDTKGCAEKYLNKKMSNGKR
jgi:excisionase family DNA binding protein